MKHLILLAHVIVLFFTKVTAQPYIPVPDSNAVWMQGTGHYNTYPNHQIATCDIPLSFGTDTVINSISYHRLYGQQVCNWLNTYTSPPPPGTVVTGTDYYPVALRAIFRQDTAQRKVYLYDMLSHKDTLLYDFGNLVVGQPYPATVTAPSYLNLFVSSQYTMALGGNTHRVWKLGTTAHSNVAEIIEGVGSSQGFAAPILIPFESMNYLHCFSKDGNVLYSNGQTHFGSLAFPSFGSCDITLGAKEQNRKNGKSLFFPNPADKVIHIESSVPLVAYRVLDITSRELLSGKFIAGDADEIDLSTLQPGVYLVTIKDKFGYETTKSIIKQ